jgi:hypothetical protein
MSKNIKIFLKIAAIAAVFVVINSFSLFTRVGQGGANCLVLTLITIKLFKDYNLKKTSKAYKRTIVVLIPIIFFATIAVASVTGRANSNLIGLSIGLILGMIIFFKKRTKQTSNR